jgi:DNA repair protein RadC
MNDNQEDGGAPSEQNTFPDALAEPEGDLLRSAFFDAPFVPRLARAPGGWRTLSKHELEALDLTLEEQDAVVALQLLVQLSYPHLPTLSLINSATVARVYEHRLGGLVHEVMFAIGLDGKNHFRAEVEVAIGGAHSLAVTPRDILRPLIRAGASSFILVHNHPSGDPTPSPQDIALTRRLIDCANGIELPLVDHVIIGARGGGYVSCLDLGVIERIT